MNARALVVLLLVLAVFSSMGSGLRAAPPQSLPAPSPDLAAALDATRAQAALRGAPLLFIENVGQFDPRARFQVRGGSGALWLAEDALWVTLLEPPQRDEHTDLQGLRDLAGLEIDNEPRRGVNIKLSFVGANPHPRLEPFHRLDTHVSYFTGNDPAKWHPDVPVWGGVRYVDLYPGIDLELTGADGQWQPHLSARAGADLSIVRLRIEGVNEITQETGDLALLRSLPFHPFPQSVDSRPHTPSGLMYSTFLGGSHGERSSAIAVDPSGAAYVTGDTWSADFPVTPGAFQTTCAGGEPTGCWDVLVAKLSPTGSTLVYATFLGSSGRDDGHSLAADASGTAYVVGATWAEGFPTTAGAFQTTLFGPQDGFVTKLSPLGNMLLYSTLLGGSHGDYVGDIVLEAGGTAVLVGTTLSSDFPTTPGAYRRSLWGETDVFVTRLNPQGSQLLYSTYFGGSDYNGPEWAEMALDASGNVYLGGSTTADDLPTTPGAFQSGSSGWSDAFAAKLSPRGNGAQDLVYATYLGGSDFDDGFDVAVDASGMAYVVGQTLSYDFPGGSYHGAVDVFVTKVNATGTGLLYSILLGSSNTESGHGVAVDGEGVAYVVGNTFSTDYPTTPGAFQTTYGGQRDAFLTKLSAGGNQVFYSSFLGGANLDYALGIALDANGMTYITGGTASLNFPTTPGAFQPTYGGGQDDTFVTKLAPILLPPQVYLPLVLNGP
jgi:hypothetical protein